jgi:hypothetical protein
VKKILTKLLLLSFLLGLGFLTYAMGSEWGGGRSMWPITIYSILISLFLGMQVYAFVISQVKYSYDIEEAKFDLLEKEGVKVEYSES